MNNQRLIITIFIVLGLLVSAFVIYRKQQTFALSSDSGTSQVQTLENSITQYPLSIEAMQKKQYPGSDFIIEQTLSSGVNYDQYIASYLSDGLKIYGLLTIPKGNPSAGSGLVKPNNGWPAIIFNHGYIPPDTYKTTERYVAYVDAFARNGYVVFKPDYRGNGNSEGQPEGAYYSPAYATDVLNALASVKRYKDVDSGKVGMWGHSMGGNIVLRDIVVNTRDIKAAVIWGGVVGSYNDLMNNWQRNVSYHPPPRELALRNNYRKRITDTYGTPDTNPTFWQAIDPTYHLAEINTPVQLHTGGNDEEVPVAFSVTLKEKLENAGKPVEYYNYPGGDHNISSPNFEIAMERSINFFNKYLKSTPDKNSGGKGGDNNEK